VIKRNDVMANIDNMGKIYHYADALPKSSVHYGMGGTNFAKGIKDEIKGKLFLYSTSA
jgi:hypothetical protein